MSNQPGSIVQEDYDRLVAERRVCHRCAPDLVNQSEVDGGRHDSPHIGAWSRWQGRLDARLMVVGQDWGDESAFRAQVGMEKRGNPTNSNLVKLLGVAGISIDAPDQQLGNASVFLTNAVLCLKSGGLQGPVKQQWFQNCSGFLRSQMAIVRPKAVVALGTKAYCAVLSAYGLRYENFRDEVQNPNGRALPGRMVVFAVYHCGARGVNINRKMDHQVNDWLRIRHYLASQQE